MKVKYNLKTQSVVFSFTNVKLDDSWYINRNDSYQYFCAFRHAELAITVPFKELEKFEVIKKDTTESLLILPQYKLSHGLLDLNCYWSKEDSVEIHFYSENLTISETIKGFIEEINKQQKVNIILKQYLQDYKDYSGNENDLLLVFKEIWYRSQSPYWEHADWNTLEQEENLN